MELSESLISGVGVHIDEALATGGEVTLIGLAIVFSVLVILMIVLMLFKVFLYKEPAKVSSAPAPDPIQAAAPDVSAVSAKKEEPEDDEELIAVLTAAVAASMNTSTYNLKIRSYRRVPNTRPAWNRAGISDTIENRF